MECSQNDDRRTFKGFYFGKCKLNIDYPLLNDEKSPLVFCFLTTDDTDLFSHRLHGFSLIKILICVNLCNQWQINFKYICVICG
jgi:hypothetical protein